MRYKMVVLVLGYALSVNAVIILRNWGTISSSEWWQHWPIHPPQNYRIPSMFSLIFHGYQSEPPNCLTFRHPCYCSNGFHLFGQAKWSQGTLLSRPRAYGTNYMAKNPLRWLWGKWKLSVKFFEWIDDFFLQFYNYLMTIYKYPWKLTPKLSLKLSQKLQSKLSTQLSTQLSRCYPKVINIIVV